MMFVIVNNQNLVLADEYDLITDQHRLFFTDLATITAINTYPTKDVTIKTFSPWFSLKIDGYHLMKKRSWIKSQRIDNWNP